MPISVQMEFTLFPIQKNLAVPFDYFDNLFWVEFKVVIYVKSGVYSGGVIRLDVYCGEELLFNILKFKIYILYRYPNEEPVVTVKTQVPHPLVNDDRILHIEHLISKDSPPSLAKILNGIHRAFSDETLKMLPKDVCVNLSAKILYTRSKFYLHIIILRFERDFDSFSSAVRAALST